MSLPKSWLAFGNGGVAAELVEQEIGVEDVNPHRRQAAVGIVGHRLGIGRLLEEFDHPVRLVDLHHAELRPCFSSTGMQPIVQSARFAMWSSTTSE